MADGSDVKVTVTIEPEDARKLAAEVFDLRERLKEAEDRAAGLEALDAEAQIGADEVSRKLRDLKAELADVRAQWAADVGSAIARAQTAEARAEQYENGRWHSYETVQAIVKEREELRAEVARLRAALEASAENSAQLVESWAKKYPDDVFDPNGATVDAIAAKTLRTVLPNIAADIRRMCESESELDEPHYIPEAVYELAALRGPAQSEKGE